MPPVRYTDVPLAWDELRELIPSVDERASILKVSPKLVRAGDHGQIRAGALPAARVRRALEAARS